MSELSDQLYDQLLPLVQKADLTSGEQLLLAALDNLPESPFHLIKALHFTNSPQAVAAYYDDFIEGESKRMSVQAIYTETNGFEINPDLWFCDVFAYDIDGGQEDDDWLCDWKSEDYDSLPLTGMEDLQEVYDSPAFSEESYEEACSVASLFVVIRFQQLIQRAIPKMKQLTCPLYVDAHDYDLTAKFVASAEN